VGRKQGKKRIRVAIAGKVPPPVGGQNINIARVIRLLGESEAIELLYWEWGFTRNWETGKRFGLGKVLELLKAIGGLLRLRLSGRIDFVLYSTGGPDVLPILRDLALLPFAWALCGKVCVYFQAAGIARKQAELPTLLTKLNRAVHRLCWGAIVITEYGRADPLALGITNIKVLPYGLEDHFSSLSARNPFDQPVRAPVIINVGHLCADKGTPQLIAACGKLRKSGHAFSLRLVGECLPPYSARQLSLDVAAAQLSDCVAHSGLLQGSALWESYRGADLFVFSSVAPYESFGLVLLEAMMMGLPAVVTDWRANADVLGRSEPAGGVVASSDESLPLQDRLGGALESALMQRQRWLEWGARNRQRYLEEFSIGMYRSRLEAYFLDSNP
jgi:glycosyltransferase involved in cell wall biosynthesis